MEINSGDGQTIFETNRNRWLVEACSYVPGPTSDEVAAQYGFLPAHIVKLSSNENPVGPSKNVVKVIRSSAGQVHRYPDAEANALREVIAAKFGLTPKNVLVGPGSSVLMMTIVVAFTAPGDEILSMQPGFNLYSEIAAIYGRQHRPLVLDENFDLDVETVWKAITPRTRLIFITRPNNPTSKLVPLKDVQEIVKIAADARAIVVSDEAYVEFAGDGASAVSQLASDGDAINLLVTRTFSKAYGLADLRLGYVLGPTRAISYLSKGKPKWGTGTLAQQAGIEALRDSAYLHRVRSLVRQGREDLSRAFTKWVFLL